MLKNRLLEVKPLIKINDETGRDLLYKSIYFDGIFNGRYLKVNEYYVARPDLISLACYGDESYGDVLCKINGISNPFELNEGMVLFIPEYDSLFTMCNVQLEQDKLNVIIDNDTLYKTSKVGMQKMKNESRSPNEQIIGDTNYIIDKSMGVIIY